MKTFFPRLLFIFVCVAIAGCASTKEEKKTRHKRSDYLKLVAPNKKPEKIYIQDFSADFSKLGADISDEELQSFKKVVVDMTSFSIMEKLFKKLVSAHRLGPKDPLPKGNYWLIKGRLTDITKENRSLNAYMNRKNGSKPTEALVWVYNSNISNLLPFMEFSTSGIPAPGITSTGMIPIMTEDTNRLGDIITARITDYMAKLPAMQTPAKSVDKK